MNPIRIASGPPTDFGHYKYRQQDEHGLWNSWVLIDCRWIGTKLCCVNFGEENIPLDEFDNGQWSTRIPDPEEM